MKRKIASLLFAGMLALTSVSAFADDKKQSVETSYTVPVKLMQQHEKDKESMANKALKPTAEAMVKEDGTEIVLHLQPIEIGGVKENINKLFIVEGDKRTEATKTNTGVSPYDVRVELKTVAKKPEEVTVAVWVNAMDQLKGGKEGAGEQLAILKLDWSKAVEEKPVPVPSNPDADKKDDKKPVEQPQTFAPKNGETLVVVYGSEVKFEAKPMMKNGRVLVPLRAIFEATDAEVKWDGKTQTITAVKDDKTLTLVIGKKEATVKSEAGAQKITLEAPASIVGKTTYVPLRFIGESFGDKVEYEKQSSGALITVSKAA